MRLRKLVESLYVRIVMSQASIVARLGRGWTYGVLNAGRQPNITFVGMALLISELKRSKHKMTDVIIAGKKKAKELGVEFFTPSWLWDVPVAMQEAAICRAMENSLRRKSLSIQVEEARSHRKSERKSLDDSIAKHGFDVTYDNICGYNVAIAYIVAQKRDGFNKLKCYFAVCSHADKDNFSRFEAKRRLLDRILKGDSAHMFHCFVPKTGRNGVRFVRSRFVERVSLDSSGLPHSLVSAVRCPVIPVWNMPVWKLQ